MRFGRLAKVVVVGMMLVSAAQSAKVISIYNPWQSVPIFKDVTPQIWGGVVNWVQDPVPATQFKPAGGNWWNFTFPNANPGDFSILNRSFRSDGVSNREDWFLYKSDGYDSALTGLGLDMNIDLLLATYDTVWMVPDPLKGGPPRFLTSRPLEITIHFWNPWESDFPGQAPSVKVGPTAWAPMDPDPAGDGWYQIEAVGFSNIDLQFRSSNGVRYLGGAGATTAPSTAVRFDSLAGARAVWVFQSKVPLGKPVASTSIPKGYVTEVFNPWDGQFPFQLPRFQFADGMLAVGKPIFDRCGWYRAVRYDSAPTAAYFVNSSGASFGYGGSSVKVGFPLSPIWGAGLDTARIYPDSLGTWEARTSTSGRTGQCFLTRLAATIHDFSPVHPAFEKFDCGLLKGMVQDTLGPNRKPLAAPGAEQCLNGTINEWFTDIPGKNYSVCRDLPLELEPDQGLYSYDNPSYFPIDDIDTTLDKFNKKFLADDGQLHNFHFCLESHAVFDYHKGQKFNFIGDDDVWVYINGKLAVDLGGVHVAETGSVSLDTLDLKEGQTYPFDFFFCERRATASHMLITTSMNLRNPPEFELRQTGISVGKRQYDLYYHQKLGQGCDAVKIDKSTPGLFYLTGPQFPAGLGLTTGIQLGGIAIRGDSAQLIYDSLAMEKLVPGTYKIRVKMALDTTQFGEITFVIPERPMPKYVSHEPWAGKTGTSMPLDIYAMLGGSQATFAVQYRIDPVPGLTFCLDSACTTILGPSEFSTTGPAGQISRIWVRGNAIGVYTLKLRNATGDSSDVRTRIVFQDRGIRWLDSLGQVVEPFAITVNSGESIRFWIESTQGAGRCDTCNELIFLDVSNPVVRILNQIGSPISSVKLKNGIGSLMLQSDVPTGNVSLGATLFDSSYWIGWSMLRWQAHPPADAVILDSDGDGRADRVVVSLTQVLDTAVSWGFRWPDSTGGLDWRMVPGSSAKVDSNGLRLTFDLPPYQFGQTSCPDAGCDNLGGLFSALGGEVFETPFKVRDGVPPVAMVGKLRFSGLDHVPDTLTVRFSEPIVPRLDMTTWVSIGDPAMGPRGASVVPWMLSNLEWTVKLDSTGTIATILVDTNVAPTKKDRIRMNPSLSGGLSDRQGNFANDTAGWGVLILGPTPPRLEAKAYPGLGRWNGLPPDPSTPILSLQVRRGIGSTADWTSLDGDRVSAPDTVFGRSMPGVKVSLNGLTDGGAYLYDNMGIFVDKISLKPIVAAFDQGLIQTDPRGRYEIWISWNGVAMGKTAPSGIYLMRIVGYRMLEGRPLVQQKVIRLGWLVRELH